MRFSLTSPPAVRRRRPARQPMIALDNTRTIRLRNPHTGRHETKIAYSADQVWKFVRQEDDDTTWTATHIATGRDVNYIPSLPYARRVAASGALLAMLEAFNPKAS